MTSLRLFVLGLFLMGSLAQAASSTGIGLNVGGGFPFLGQAGLDIIFSEKLGLSVGYNLLELDTGDASASLSMPEAILRYHPFSGSFFIGAGAGHEKLKVTAVESIGTNKVSIEVDAMTTIIKTGWMWGLSNSGFWFGIDLSYIMPLNPNTKITAPGVPTTDPNYVDAQDAAKKFGETSYLNITFARLGWVF